MEFCTNCGDFFVQLDDLTGWCFKCAGKPEPGHNENIRLKWLTEHADELEDLLAKGLSLKSAIRQVRDEIRPICLSCNQPIKGGRKDSWRDTYFCRKTKKCRSAQRRLRTLREGAARLSTELALEQIFREA